jgi:hypothetical protein
MSTLRTLSSPHKATQCSPNNRSPVISKTFKKNQKDLSFREKQYLVELNQFNEQARDYQTALEEIRLPKKGAPPAEKFF